MKWFTRLIVVWLVCASCAADNDELTKSELEFERQNIIYLFKSTISAAEGLCLRGEKDWRLGYSPVGYYKERVASYNAAQADLKQRGHKGPAEYPAKIPNYDKAGHTDWCTVQAKVTGLSCADDL